MFFYVPDCLEYLMSTRMYYVLCVSLLVLGSFVLIHATRIATLTHHHLILISLLLFFFQYYLPSFSNLFHVQFLLYLCLGTSLRSLGGNL